MVDIIVNELFSANSSLSENLLVEISNDIIVNELFSADSLQLIGENLLVESPSINIILTELISTCNSQMIAENILIERVKEIILTNNLAVDNAIFKTKYLKTSIGVSINHLKSDCSANTAQFKTGIVIFHNADFIYIPIIPVTTTTMIGTNILVSDNSDLVQAIIFNGTSNTTVKTGVVIATTNPSRYIYPIIFNAATSALKSAITVAATDGRKGTAITVPIINSGYINMTNIKIFTSESHYVPFEIECDFSLGVHQDTKIDQYYNLLIN